MIGSIPFDFVKENCYINSTIPKLTQVRFGWFGFVCNDSGVRKKISVISEISVVRKHGNIDGNIGIISISIKITWKPRKL